MTRYDPPTVASHLRTLTLRTSCGGASRNVNTFLFVPTECLFAESRDKFLLPVSPQKAETPRAASRTGSLCVPVNKSCSEALRSKASLRDHSLVRGGLSYLPHLFVADTIRVERVCLFPLCPIARPRTVTSENGGWAHSGCLPLPTGVACAPRLPPAVSRQSK